ncbi:hypothetical protein SAMN06295998_102220 [Primorskyibacter flagellatus]|uniref:Uncharacterized protein n=1 Tax=Primorskyibacter flagellatus TaxID=1387277 RepID=A0A1W1ZY83_9RHOB|nr:hypothetical protein SAMN06295998_102220 [Primorskyibacter flagellatus]
MRAQTFSQGRRQRIYNVTWLRAATPEADI